jgi:hypothetical protein
VDDAHVHRFGTAEDTYARYKLLLKEGATGLSAALDLPTQLGYDPDASLAAGEVGRVGVAPSTAKDMEDLFDGIPPDQASTNFTVNATAPMMLAQYIVAGENQGVAPDKLNGSLQNNMLKEYAARYLDLSTCPIAAPHSGRHRILRQARAQIQSDQYLQFPPQRGGGQRPTGHRLHLCQYHDLRPARGRTWDRYRCLRATIEFQPGHPLGELLRTHVRLACRSSPVVKDHA